MKSMRIGPSGLVGFVTAGMLFACGVGGGGRNAVAADSTSAVKTIGKIERLDPALDELIDASAPIEVLGEGYDWSEGPVWVPAGNFLLFSDVPKNTVHQWRAGKGVTPYLTPSGYTSGPERGGEMGSNGLTLDPQGRLVLCQHGDRRVARLDAPLAADKQPEAKFITLADKYEGKRFSSPNDVTFHSSGVAFFTDPPYGLEKQFDDPGKETPVNGVYRIGVDGKVTLVYDKLKCPNGIAFSPDEKTLYVANSDPENPIITAFDVNKAIEVGNGRVFFDAKSLQGEGRKGLPDGMRVDAKGNLFATGPGGVMIISPEGKHLGTISPGKATANCAFGEDGSTLFMTSDMYLCRVRLKTKGPGF